MAPDHVLGISHSMVKKVSKMLTFSQCHSRHPGLDRQLEYRLTIILTRETQSMSPVSDAFWKKWC